MLNFTQYLRIRYIYTLHVRPYLVVIYKKLWNSIITSNIRTFTLGKVNGQIYRT